MSRENVEIVRSGFEAFARGDLEAVRATLSGDLVTYRAEPDGATYHGPDGFFRATSEWTEDFREWSVAPGEFLDIGDRVVVRVHQTARGGVSGVPVESDSWFVYTLREGMVVRLEFFMNREQAVESAGL